MGGDMPKIDQKKVKNAIKYFQKIKVFTINQLVSSLNCSAASARLKLKQWKVYTSYNQNGRYYAMPTAPRFDENGLWRYQYIYFSKHGNLKNTLIHLVNQSSSGLTGNQIGDIVGLSPRSFLHHFRDTPGICREKHGGVYVYFSENPDKYKEQLQKQSTAVTRTAKFLTDADAVVILTALIKHHHICIEDIMALPEIKARNFSAFVIREFLDRHGLVKKTPTTKP
jgi:hypothetical protein